MLSFCVSFIVFFFKKKNLYFLVALRLSCGVWDLVAGLAPGPQGSPVSVCLSCPLSNSMAGAVFCLLFESLQGPSSRVGFVDTG